MKKLLLGAAAIAAAVAAAWFFLLRPHPAFSGNVLLITLDTTRADHLGAYGRRPAHTPALDRLAAAGVLFEACVAPVPLTLPSHCTLFTGRWPIAHQVRNNGTYFLPPAETTLAERLQAHGYETGAVVAAYVLLSKFGLNQGFDRYDDSLDSHEIARNYKSEIPADRVYDKFSSWLQRRGGRPFFAWVHFYDPHTPYLRHAETAARFPDTPAGSYEGEISYMDGYLGRLVDDLGRRGLLDDTLIVVAGDHGEAFAEHGERGHGVFCYEESLHVPLIFYQPRLLGAPRRVAGRVGLVDVAPTVLDLLGLPIPAEVQGRSLAPWLRGGGAVPERPLYFESLYGREEMNWAPLTGLSDGGFKYISLPDAELYDLGADRGERRNLLLRRNALARDMDQRLAAFVRAHAGGGAATRRELSAADRDELQALGYISAFSRAGGRELDPKRGIRIDEQLKAVNQLIDEGDVDGAERRLNALLAEHPDLKMPHVYNMRYKICSRRRDGRGMYATLLQAIADFPEVEQFRITLAVNLFDARAYDRAETRCRELLQRNPRLTRAWILLGDIREKQAAPGEAAGFYRRALELEPQNVSLGIKLAEMLIRDRRFAEAVPVYERIADSDEVWRQPDFVMKIALFQAQYGDPGRAAAMLEKMTRLHPGGAAFYHYALVLARNGRGEAAAAAMQAALGRFANELSADQQATARRALQAWRGSGGGAE